MNRSLTSRLRSSTAVIAVLATCAGVVVLAAPAQARNRVTPGSFTGYGFDQCVAPSQAVMDTWLTSSPYWAVGIYISGDSRGCVDQPNLTRGWISTQLRHGWRLLPLTVGPQASCSTRANYVRQDRISPDPARNYATARTQGRREAAKTVRAARALGISARSTLWYDLEAFSISGTRCRESALGFLSGWTRKLHALRYVSGVYSSAASGIKVLDDAAATRRRYAEPDQIWIADWNGTADINSSYVRSTSWMPHKRVHQYLGGHKETYGGVTINIDSNFMSLGHGSVAPKSDNACGVGISLFDYHRIGRGDSGDEVKAVHCLLKRTGTYTGRMHGTFNRRTVKAVVEYQKAHDIRATGVVSLRTWTTILSAGTAPVLKYGSAGLAVRRLQRALNAAADAHLATTGVYTTCTARSVREYQRAIGLRRTGVVAGETWAELNRGSVATRPVSDPRTRC